MAFGGLVLVASDHNDLVKLNDNISSELHKTESIRQWIFKYSLI